MQQVHFLHITGTLYENQVYKHKSCFESSTAKRYAGDENYQVILLNADKSPLLQVAPKISGYCGLASDADRYAVVACLPLHPDGASFEIRRGSLLLYACDIPKKSPALHITKSATTENKISIEWKSPCKSFSVVAKMESGRRISLVRNFAGHSFLMDKSTIRASGKGKIMVVAHDGVRSTEAMGPEFELADQPPIINIITPIDNSEEPFGYPISVCASYYDIDGKNLDAQHLICTLDGERVEHTCGIVALHSVLSGKHLLSFTCEGPWGKTESSVIFNVAEPDKAYAEWLALVERSANVEVKEG